MNYWIIIDNIEDNIGDFYLFIFVGLDNERGNEPNKQRLNKRAWYCKVYWSLEW